MVPAILASAMAAVAAMVTMATGAAETTGAAGATTPAEITGAAEAKIAFRSGAKASLSLYTKLFRTTGPACGSGYADGRPRQSRRAIPQKQPLGRQRKRCLPRGCFVTKAKEAGPVNPRSRRYKWRLYKAHPAGAGQALPSIQPEAGPSHAL